MKNGYQECVGFIIVYKYIYILYTEKERLSQAVCQIKK